jgi:hypothetical protein
MATRPLLHPDFEVFAKQVLTTHIKVLYLTQKGG